MKNKKIKLKIKNIILILLFIICLILFVISIINIVRWKIDSKEIDKQIEVIQGIATIEEVNDDDNIQVIDQEEIPKSNPYWDYIGMNLINVNFNELKSINSSTMGWIQVNGTNVNYPFVQASDNDYYLTHAFDKSYNSAGWVFLDYRNNIREFKKNTIIYAHSRLDNTMFGSLKNVLKGEWLNDYNNYVVRLSTEYENTLWQIFSIYHIPTTSDYIQVDFDSNEEFINWSNMLINRSVYNFNTSINENDNILTLSTCYNNSDKERLVAHAKLIKKSIRQ